MLQQVITRIAIVAALAAGGCTSYHGIRASSVPLTEISQDELQMRIQGLSNQRIHVSTAYANAVTKEQKEYYGGRLYELDDLLECYHAEHDRRVRLGLID